MSKDNTAILNIKQTIDLIVHIILIEGPELAKLTKKPGNPVEEVKNDAWTPECAKDFSLGHDLINNDFSKTSECPSSYCKASARALARVATSMAMRGQIEGR